MHVCTALAVLISMAWISSASLVRRAYGTHDYYVVEHDPRQGVDLEVSLLALGLQLVEPVGALANHWLTRRPKTEPSTSETPESLWRRLQSRAAGYPRRDGVMAASILSVSLQTPHWRTKRALPPLMDSFNPESIGSIALHFGIEDPNFSDQWHLVNEEAPEHSMNATGIWDIGVTGQGVTTALIDDGLDFESNDLAANFDALGSYDFNDQEDLPKPKKWDDTHGTRCAGQIAAGKNDVCGVGIAYNSKVAGLRILSGPITDADEAAALNYGYQNTSIYSCSWGPPDDGVHMDAPPYLVEKAVVNGITHGRGGRGSVYVYASGNGAASGDQCNFDGYTNSIFTITVAGIDRDGGHPYYSESCAANLVVAYTSGSGAAITTTDVGKDKCSHSHGGTSAAAPNVAGVIALALSTRPELTWRDLQHLAVATAAIVSPDDPDWEVTSTGRLYSYKYGFGKMDAYRYVTAAMNWTPVKPQAWLEVPPLRMNNGTMDEGKRMSGGASIPLGGITSSTTITADMMKSNNLEALEHVTVRVWVAHDRRGDVEVELISPNGVKSVLAATRPRDISDSGFPGWRFMSVKHWGEDPLGDWTIRVSDQADEDLNGYFLGWNLVLWGSTIDPGFAKPYEVNPSATILAESSPPVRPSIVMSISTTQHSNPTAVLPNDHNDAAAETESPALQNQASPSTETMTNMSVDHIPGSRWVVGLVLIAILLGALLCAFCRRRQRSNIYLSLDTDDAVGMSTMADDSVSGAIGHQERYHIIGESDDEDLPRSTASHAITTELQRAHQQLLAQA
ncbi:hypothetical protein PUNSTDRAFT_70782 [Punctularia strigosozonata HHB-11173 SS5]|uniref:uncharacterized protein n=1 Tax=Punctularia strigosozonata (strain HHB-11173) TaxID=741275 RepID=UPI000441702D|nr:uncharacterized protein PUNSTDRAFT_70782 [Punctularia strigosozonata HHB-11173 SS5]EIN07045.1 hypothetical protein PUNSTDRAFT_70782 [Punctularia strigosozonata HHB-11173 SS5]